MALIPIMGQPVNLVPDNERSLNCNEQGEYCVVYKKSSDINDRIMVQMKQEPCGENLIVDGDFPDGDNWTIVTGDIVFADGKANHVTGSSAELSQAVADVDLGNYYKVSVTVTGMTAGTLDLYFTQSGISRRITENGIYTFYLFNLDDNDNIAFVWSSDCDASISGVSAYKLLIDSDIVANLLDADGNIVSAMFIEYHDEALIFSKSTNDLDEGCYTVQIIDPCIIAGIMTPLFNDPDFDDAGAWTVTSNSPNAYIGMTDEGSFIFDEDATVPSPVWAKASQPFAFPTGVKLLLKITVDLCNLGGENLSLNNLVVYVEDSGEIQEIIKKNTNSCLTGLSTFYVVIQSNYLNSSNLDMGFMIDDKSSSSGNYSFVEYAQVEYVILDNDTQGYYQSNCLQVSSVVEGTRLVEGFADFTTTTSTSALAGRSLGFLFVADRFWLRSRIPVQFSNPHSPIKTENALYSNGTKKKLFAQISKIWDVTFSEVDENMHDTITNIINCDTFKIDGFEYITDEKEYSANYGPKGVDTVGESTIEAGRIDGTRFNLNV